MNQSHVIAGIIGFVFLTAVACFGLAGGEDLAARNCINHGKVTLGDRVFECHEVGKEIKP